MPDESYEIIPVTPLKRLEKRMERIEGAGTVPQLQSLINQIIELIRSNQKIVNDVIQANSELRNEMSKLPSKIDEMTTSMKSFISLIEAAGKEEFSTPGPEIMKPVTEQLSKMVEQNQKILESNQAMLDKLDNLARRPRGGTPVSELLTSYPGIRLRREVK
jgi:DNA-directed RNA polymerase sigma subunit (sigma70/sigma32)